MPSISEVRFSPLLTNIIVMYKNENYVQDELFPTLPSPNDSGYYFERGREHFRIQDTIRASGTPAKVVDYTVTKSLYLTQEHALREVVDKKTQKNSPAPLKPLVDAAEDLAERMKLAKEKAVFDLLSNTTGTFDSYTRALATYNGTTNPIYVPFDDYTYSDPRYIVGLIKVAILKQCGKMPNFILMNPETERVIANHPKELAKKQYVVEVKEETLPDTWCGLKVVRAKAVYDSSIEGETESNGFLWSYGNVFIGYVEPRPGIKKASVGYCFEHEALAAKQWWDDLIDSTHIQLGYDYVLQVIGARCGYLLTSCLATNPAA